MLTPVFAYVSGGIVMGDWLLFFTLHGVYVVAETFLRGLLRAKAGLTPPRWLSIPLTLSFLLYTGEQHFFKPVRELGIDQAVVANIASLLE